MLEATKWPAKVAAPDPKGLLEVGRSEGKDRESAGLILALGIAWLVYTRLYFWLHPRGLTVAPSLFMHVTGKPDPLCGLTRTFAWMWRGDLRQAVAVYPLGPAVFLGAFPLLGYALFVLVTGRVIRLRVSPTTRRLVFAAAISLLVLNWTAKLLWLGV